MERTLLLIKPGAVQRGYIGEIITRFEKKGLKLVGIKMINLTDDVLDEHYAHLADFDFFPNLKNFMKSNPVVAICLEGLDAIFVVRKICGATNSRDADVGTIRGDLGMSVSANLVHASDSKENAAAEIKRFFKDEELFSYGKVLCDFLYSPDERKK
jgi:nucleoside-diphosphate kinase